VRTRHSRTSGSVPIVQSDSSPPINERCQIKSKFLHLKTKSRTRTSLPNDSLTPIADEKINQISTCQIHIARYGALFAIRGRNSRR
jgi:hypothetical protein